MTKEKVIEEAQGELGEILCGTILRLEKQLFFELPKTTEGWTAWQTFQQLSREINTVDEVLNK